MSNSEIKKIAEKKTAQIVKSELDKKAYEDIAWLQSLKKANGNEEEDWMQWHHEELIRDNKVFETVQLKLDI